MKALLSIFVFFSYFCAQAQNSQDTLSIYFDHDKDVIDAQASSALEAFNASEHGEIVSIIAHCDSSGSNSYNLKLAQRRLDAAILVVDSTATTTIAEGENISSKSANYDAALFRRVDIIFNSQKTISLKDQFKNFAEDTLLMQTSIDVNIVFYPGEARIKPESYQDVKDLFSFMKNNKTIDVHIHGHVCCGHNYVLSKNRAHAIYMYLLENRISYKRLKYTGHSNTQPKVWPETTADDKDANRRVSLAFTKK